MADPSAEREDAPPFLALPNSSPKKAKADDAEEQAANQTSSTNAENDESNTENGENKTAPADLPAIRELQEIGGSSGWDSPAEATQPTQCHQEAQR